MAPIALLIVFYVAAERKKINGRFNRILLSDGAIVKIDTVFPSISINEDVDGIKTDKGDLWINKRFSISKYTCNGVRKSIDIDALHRGVQNPIINFYVDGDSVFYCQANLSQINVFNLRLRKHAKPLGFDFNFSYFTKMGSSSFLFQEINSNGSEQVRIKRFDNAKDLVNQNVFSREPGTGMKNSGTWAVSSDLRHSYFLTTHNDFLYCINREGSLKYKRKTIDFQGQNLQIINEGNRTLLSPKVDRLHGSLCVSGKNLFVSSYVRENKQKIKDFDNNLTIDVYNADDGKYRFSFYLPNFSGGKAYDFAVADNKTLYALYHKSIVVYDLSQFLKNEN